MNSRDTLMLKAHQASRFLDNVEDLTELGAVRAALLRGGYDEFEVDDMLSDAIRSEKDRRVIKRLIRAPLEIACCIAFLVGLATCLLPNDALAMSLPLPADDWSPLKWIGGSLFLFIALLVLYAVLPERKPGKAKPDCRPFGDTGGWTP